MVLEISYGLGCAAFVILTVLTVLNRKPAGMGRFAVALFAVTAVWAFAEASHSWMLPGLTHVLGGFRSWLWLQFIATVLMTAERRGAHHTAAFYRIFVPALGVFAVLNDLRFLYATASPIDYSVSQVYMRIILSIAGLLLVENLLRNTRESRRWHIFPLCLSAGALFAYDLFVFAEALILRSVDLSLFAARGIVLVLMVPPLVVTMVRNEDWRIDIHVSRRVVFHTATLTAGGFFLLAAAGAASMFGRIQGEWGSILKVVFFCGSAFVLAAVASTESLRSRARRLIAENFFSRRYDYREEWLRFVETLSSSDDLDSLQIRVIRAIGNIVDSPGGALWLETRGSFRLIESVNLTLTDPKAERADSAFIAAFAGGKHVVDLKALAAHGQPLPPWATAGPPVWLAVPLVQINELVGFIVLAPPRAPLTLNWESFDLLGTVGRQAASYLMEEEATRALVDAESFIEYNKKFAFIVHDVKNFSSQLGMMVSNIRRYSDHPEFRADMIRTLENSVGRLNGLLSRLRSDGGAVRPRDVIDPVPVIKALVAELSGEGSPVDLELATGELRIRMDGQELSSVLTHLVTNALEASRAGAAIRVRVKAQDSHVLIDVEDEGPGMDPYFVRNELFKPLRSTKLRGHGIGAFQAREIVRGAGGELEVISALGRGTIMRIMLPRLDAGADAQATQVSQKVAGA